MTMLSMYTARSRQDGYDGGHAEGNYDGYYTGKTYDHDYSSPAKGTGVRDFTYAHISGHTSGDYYTKGGYGEHYGKMDNYGYARKGEQYGKMDNYAHAKERKYYGRK